VTAKREAILAKIKALLSKTTAAGCTEAEAIAALALATKLRNAYEVTDGDLAEAERDGAEVHEDEPDPSDPYKIKAGLAGGIEALCGIRMYLDRRGGGPWFYVFIGTRVDIDYARWLLDTLAEFVWTRSCEEAFAAVESWGVRERKSFVLACTHRIRQRMCELAKPPEGQTDNAKALVVIKSNAITGKMKQLSIRLRKTGGSRMQLDPAAYAAGYAAGDDASFGRPVEGAGGIIRIGK
jgi:hypothetical protein